MMALFRLLSRLGLRWALFAALSRFVARRVGRTTVEKATRDLEAAAHERLPAPVAKAVSALPPEALHVGGSAVVAGRAAKTAVTTTRRAASLASTAGRHGATSLGAARAAMDQVRTETESSRRRLRSRYLSATVGPDAATDALLDLRDADPDVAPSTARPESAPPAGRWLTTGRDEPFGGQDDPHDAVPGPVAAGRRRRRRTTRPLVDRVRRSYRPATKPWDRER